jgi:hypothetical protein
MDASVSPWLRGSVVLSGVPRMLDRILSLDNDLTFCIQALYSIRPDCVECQSRESY